jgi:hypothetical protein
VEKTFPHPESGPLGTTVSAASNLRGLLLPGALLVTIGAKLFAPFMFIDLGFSPFF